MSTTSNASQSVRDQVILANQEFYRQIAIKYDHYEYCASDPFFQNVIEQDLEIIKSKLPSRSEPIRCLDCGGGTGNVALKMRTPRDSTHGRAVISPGDLAEYHARHGIDDDAVAETLAKLGFRVERRRYAVGRTRFMRTLNDFARVLLNFRVLARRSNSAEES